MTKHRHKIAAMLLAVLSAVCLLHALRAGLSQVLYQRAKFGPPGERPARALGLCRTAFLIYPYSYWLCAYAGRTAYRAGLDAPAEEAEAWFEHGRRWMRRGLKLNRHKRGLRLLEVRLLEFEHPEQALAKWQEYVDERFWSPRNHAVLVGLYARAGRFHDAARALEWVRDDDYREAALTELNQAWRQELAPPPAASAAP